MKKLFAMILAAMMILCSCAFAETTDNSLQAILDKGTLVLGLDASFEPMGYTNMDGEIVGYDIDLAKEVCARLGVELVVQPIEWAAKELELSSGNIDCIWNGMSITPERQESMALSEAYMNNQIVLLVCDGLPLVLRWVDRTFVVDVPVLSGLVLPYLLLPAAGFCSGVSLGKRQGVCPLYPLACFLCYLPMVWLLFNGSALFHCFMIAVPALMGNVLGWLYRRAVPKR